MTAAASVDVKICGITEPAGLDAAVAHGARWLGFVFFDRSPRHLTLDRAAALRARVPPSCGVVALVVTPSDDALDALAPVAPDLIQLHGAESPERVAEIRARGTPVMKALGVGGPEDVARLAPFEAVADRLLVDARPPKDAPPGGNGVTFDWSLIAGRRWAVPWMLAGGLTAETVAGAIRATGAPAVDVSSGVESAPGVKDPGRIAAFLTAARDP